MDSDSLSNLLILLPIIIFQATVTLTYTTLAHCRSVWFQEDADAGNSNAAHIIRLLETPVRMRVTYQVTTIIIRFVMVTFTVVEVVQPVLAELRATQPTTAALPVYLAILIPVGIVTLIFGDLIPASVGAARAEALAAWAVYPMRALMVILAPLTMILIVLRRVLLTTVGGGLINAVTEEEILDMLNTGEEEGTIESDERQMIYSVFQLDDTSAREVMVPRIDIVAVEINTSLQDALRVFIESGHSRIPVYEDHIDNIKGLLYAKDLLAVWQSGTQDKTSIADLIRTAYFVHETKPADELLKELQNRKVHLAIVMDEYGGTAGLVTIENLLEEIVGDILDEYDTNEEADYIQHAIGEYTIDGSMDLDDLNDLLDSDLPTDDNDTLGGFIYAQLGRVPEEGEQLEFDGLNMRIDKIEGRRIRKVYVTRKEDAESLKRSESSDDGDDEKPKRESAQEEVVSK
ncbi:MAG: HlyC/CorC family transporter [Chloroflexi bacterium]|nr:MAG: HlyC/CorC family transporter [Chloroflexota bacterium]